MKTAGRTAEEELCIAAAGLHRARGGLSVARRGGGGLGRCSGAGPCGATAAGNDSASPLGCGDWGGRYGGETEISSSEVDSIIRAVQAGVVLACRKACAGYGRNQPVARPSARGGDHVIRMLGGLGPLVVRNHSDIRIQGKFVKDPRNGYVDQELNIKIAIC